MFRGSRNARIGSIVLLALVLTLTSGVIAQGALSVKKQFTADISPHSVGPSSDVTFTATITNKAVSQSLGSCNITAPSGFTLRSTSNPSTGTAAISGNVLQLRNLATAPMGTRTVSFLAATPAATGVYTWGIECRQANNFSPDQPSNRFSIAPNSNLNTTVASPLPAADIAVVQTDSPDPVVGANTVEYTVTVSNNGPAPSGTITITDSLPSGGSITSISGEGWSCAGSGASASCTRTDPPLASGTSAAPVKVLVLAPNSNTTISNRAVVSQSGAADPSGANNTSEEPTTVQTDATCATGFVSCAIGQITFNRFSQVTSGSTPTLTRFLVGTTSFNAVAGAVGGQIWRMSAPAVPGNFCPTDFSDTVVTQCTWQMNLDPIHIVYPTGSTTFVGICYVGRCPQNPFLPGAGTIVVYIGDDGSHEILPGCSGSGDTRKCFEQQRVPGGHLMVTVRNLVAGDPKIGGICLGGRC